MSFQIIKAEELIEKNYGATKVTNIINNKNWPFSLAKVKKVGDDIKTGHDTESDVVYYVLKGKGKCVVEGKEYDVKEGDCIIYQKGTNYKHLKGLTLLAISIPPFNRNKRKYVE